MKKAFSILAAIVFVVSSVATAQSTSPRFGTTASTDNTYRKLTNGYTAVTDVAGADTVTLVPNKFNNVYRVVLLDSLQMKSPTVTNCYAGDELTLIISAASGTPKIKFATGGNWLSAGTATLSTNLRSIIRFYFDGAKWVEAGRVTQ